MHKVILRRAFNLGNFETLHIEATGEDNDLNQARLKAAKAVLELAQQEFVRIFNIRVQNINNNPWDQVALELNGINAELGRRP
jgi:hypothetical protein